MKKIISLILTLCVMASLAICPVSADSADSLNVAYAGNGIFNVTGTVSGAEGAEYKLIMAEFDDENVFVGATTILDIETETFSTTLDFTANDKLASTVKLMLWDMKTATPVAEAVVNPKATGGVNVATSDKIVIGGTGSANSGLDYPIEGLVDGNDDTYIGFYANSGDTGYIYIDLQDYYKIDRIEVLSYSDNPELNNAGARGTEYDVVLGNEVPDGTAFDAENPDGEFKAAYVGFDARAKDKSVGYKTIYVPENADECRYVSFEKWESGRAGLLIAEVRVYVKEENIPQYVNVAAGKFAGGAMTSEDAWGLMNSNETGNYVASVVGIDAAANLVDGDPKTGTNFSAATINQGNMYVDLGAEYKISHIKVLSYNNTMADRSNGYTVIMSNSVRNGAKCPDPNKYEFAQVVDSTICADASTAKYRTFIAPNDDAKYRFVSVEKFIEGAGLNVAEIEVYVDAEEAEAVTLPKYVDVATGKTTGGAMIDPSTGAAKDVHYSPASMVDGDETTAAGFWEYSEISKGYMYVDLGRKHKIDHIEVVAYEQYRPATAGEYDVYVSNHVPFDATSPDNKVLVDHANYDSQMTSAANSVRRFYMPAGDNEYRFVSFEKLQKSSLGMMIREVKIYVEEDELPATNVALGKGAGGTYSANWYDGYGDQSIITNGKTFSEDGAFCFSQQIPSWFCLDLEQIYDIEEVMVETQGAIYSSNVSVYLSNQPADKATGALPAEYTTILDGQNAAAWDSASKTIVLDTPVNARYVIVHRNAYTTPDDAHFRLSEIEVFGKAVLSNVALGKGAGSTYSANWYDGYGDQSIITNGKTFSEDSAFCFSQQIPSWFCLDLEKSYDIEEVMVETQGAAFSSNVSVYLSNQPADKATGALPAEYTTILDGQNAAAWDSASKTIVLDTPVNARYVIVYRNAYTTPDDAHFRLSEIEVWGK